MRQLSLGLVLLSSCVVPCAAGTDALLTPDNTGLYIISVNPANGSLTQFAAKPAGQWLDVSIAIDSSSIGNLRQAMQVGSEVWVTDQFSNAIYRYSVQKERPRFLGTLWSVMNPRGLGIVNGEVWIASGNTGTGTGVARLDFNGNLLGTFSAEDPFAVYSLDAASVLTANIQQNRLDRYSASGTIGAFSGVWSGSSLLDFPMQIGRWNESGLDRVVAVGFSGFDPGLYVYNAATGAFVKRVPTIMVLPEVTVMNPRGFSPLATGELVWTGSQGIFAVNAATGNSRVLYTGDNFSCGFVSPVDFAKYCAGDINNDSLVDDSDFSKFAVAYNELICPLLESGYPVGCPADLNGDGLVDDADFLIFVAAYNTLICP